MDAGRAYSNDSMRNIADFYWAAGNKSQITTQDALKGNHAGVNSRFQSDCNGRTYNHICMNIVFHLLTQLIDSVAGGVFGVLILSTLMAVNGC
jgi:hypothetical protein